MEEYASSYRECVGAPFPETVTWYTDAGKARKIVEKRLTYSGGPWPVTVVWEFFADDGTTILQTITDTITYDGPFEATRTRAIS